MAYGFNDDKSKFDLTGILKFQRLLTSADDLNNIVEPGIYVYNTNNAPNNSPYNNASIVEVTVEDINKDLIQRVTRVAARASSFRGRYRGSSGRQWTAWAEVALKENVDSINTQVTTNKNNIATLNTQVTGIRNNAVAYIDPNAESEQITRVTMNAGTERTFNLTKKGYYYIYFSRTSASGTLYGAVEYNNGIYLPLSRSGYNNDIEILIPLEPGRLRVINSSTIQAYFGIQYYKPAAI